jgi:ATP-dependent helicase/nuclease subunit B
MPHLRAAHALLDGLMQPLRGHAPLSAWPAILFRILTDLYAHRKLDRSRPKQRELLDVLATIKAVGREIAMIPPTADLECDGADAAAILLESLRAASVPRDPDRAAVELLGWLEMQLDDAPVALITGFNEPHLPESIVSDAFLPDGLRRRLDLLDNDTRFARDAYQLVAILRSRRRVCCIAGRMTADGDPLRPSRLMLACSGDELARRVLRFTTRADDHQSPVVPARRQPASHSAFVLPPEPVLRFEPPHQISVTAFRTFLDNPFLFALQAAHRLDAVDDRAREMDGGLFGSIAHEVLGDFGRSKLRATTDPDQIAAALDELLALRTRRFGDGRMLPSVRLQIELLRQRLHAFARWQARRAAEGWEIVLVEGSPANDDTAEDRTCRARFEVDGEPVTLSGRVDRVDRHRQSGAYAILDYKTSDRGETPDKSHRKGRGDDREWKDLQLPLYRHLMTLPGPDGEEPLIPDAHPDAIHLGFVLLPRTATKVGESMAEWEVADLHAADETARQVVREIRAGRAAFDPERRARYFEPRLAALCGDRLLDGAASDDDL